MVIYHMAVCIWVMDLWERERETKRGREGETERD